MDTSGTPLSTSPSVAVASPAKRTSQPPMAGVEGQPQRIPRLRVIQNRAEGWLRQRLLDVDEREGQGRFQLGHLAAGVGNPRVVMETLGHSQLKPWAVTNQA
jgi:hypothetical protein